MTKEKENNLYWREGIRFSSRTRRMQLLLNFSRKEREREREKEEKKKKNPIF